MKQAMILAAGRGSRLAPLTDTVPKPLLPVGDDLPLLRHLRRLAAAGVTQVAINLHHLGGQIRAAVGDGGRFGVAVRYSPEEQLLGSAGGIRMAIERGLLTAPFILLNGDVVCDYDLSQLASPPPRGCRLLLVPPPPAKTRGDFSIGGSSDNSGDNLLPPAEDAFTYAGMGSYDPALFSALAAGQAHDMLPLLQQAIAAGTARAEVYRGRWHDIGTPNSLAQARRDCGEEGRKRKESQGDN